MLPSDKVPWVAVPSTAPVDRLFDVNVRCFKKGTAMWWICVSAFVVIPLEESYLQEWKTHTLPFLPAQMEREYTTALNNTDIDSDELRGKLYVRRGALRNQLGVEGGDTDIVEGARLAPQDATCMFEYGKLLCRQRKAGSARVVAEVLLSQHPKRFEGYYIKSHIAIVNGDRLAALAALDEAIGIDNSVAFLYLQKGKLLFHEHRYRDCERALARAHALGPWTVSLRDQSAACSIYAKTLAIAGRAADGLPYAIKALDFCPNSEVASNECRDACEALYTCADESGRKELALRAAKHFVKEFPDLADGQWVLAASSAACGDFEQADRTVGRLKLRADGESDRWTWQLAGMIAWRADRIDEAERAFTEALKLSPSDHDSSLRLALLHVAARGDGSMADQERCRSALSTCEAIINERVKNKQPIDNRVALLHAIVIAANSQFGDACDRIERILKQKPGAELSGEALNLLNLFKSKKRYRVTPGDPHFGDLPFSHSLMYFDRSVD